MEIVGAVASLAALQLAILGFTREDTKTLQEETREQIKGLREDTREEMKELRKAMQRIDDRLFAILSQHAFGSNAASYTAPVPPSAPISPPRPPGDVSQTTD